MLCLRELLERELHATCCATTQATAYYCETALGAATLRLDYEPDVRIVQYARAASSIARSVNFS